MSDNRDIIKEITHKNVERLVEAMRSDRELRNQMNDRLNSLEKTVQQLLIKLTDSERKANLAMAMAQQGRL